MRIVYIGHQISGDVEGNLQKIKDIMREINLTMPDVLPFAHYVVDCQVLNDLIPEERKRGIKNDVALLKAGFINELWLYGPKISHGMKCEIELAIANNISVFAKTIGTQRDLYDVLNSIR
jgi:hypothetical protein